MDKEVYLKIDGRVQGIGFRAWAVRTARELGVSGWVRNVDDGTVEIRMKGAEEQIDEMILHDGLQNPFHTGKSV